MRYACRSVVAITIAVLAGIMGFVNSAHASLTPEQVAQAKALGYVSVPGGYTHPSCVHAVPSGSLVDAQGQIEGSNVSIAPCAYAPIFDRPGLITPPPASPPHASPPPPTN